MTRAADPDHAGSAPSPWVVRFAALVPEGATVLDVACGGGRHSRLFLALGHPVVAVDREVRGLDALRADAQLEVVEADLETDGPFPLAGRTFGAVVVANYLHRPILDALTAAVGPGGVLIYETFAGQRALRPPDEPRLPPRAR